MTTMSELSKKIKQREQKIHERKNKLHQNLDLLSKKIGAPSSIGVSLLTSIFVGFMLPRSISSIFRRRKKPSPVTPIKEITPAQHVSTPKIKASRLHSLLFMLTDILAIVSAMATFKEAFAKISQKFRKA